MNSKESVRQAGKARRAALSNEVCQQWAKGLCKEIIKLPAYKKAKSLMLYLAMPKEANLDGVITEALADGKKVYVPLCVTKTKMVAVRLFSLDDIEYGVLHIRVPKKPHQIVDAHQIDLILVPGLCFDKAGGRMGMGNGYYDRFLADLDSTKYIGVCWSMQILESLIPMEQHDHRLPALVTELGYIECKVKSK